MTPLLVVITGPTAVGKTALCVKIAQHFKTAIISADSRQFYKELSIGTAKPTVLEMQGIPHYFVDSHSIQQKFNVSHFEKEALSILDQLFSTQSVVILTGGSGLYIDALCEGFDAAIPGGDTEIRVELEHLHQKYGIGLLQEKLKQLDPPYYKEVDLSNVKRLQRAIEVCMVTGQKYSAIRQGNKQERPFRVLRIGLNRPRTELFERINQRVESMMDQGLLEEVKAVEDYQELNALKTVGYSELFDFLNNKCTLTDAVEKIKVNTRRYAKRQLSWFQKNETYQWFIPSQEAEIIEEIESNLK